MDRCSDESSVVLLQQASCKPSSNMSKATFMERALTHSRTEQLIVLQEYTTVVVIVVATASGGQILETLERWNKTALERNKESIE